jgi:hypothetical protein
MVTGPPTATPVTTPEVGFTLAMVGAEELQVTVRPLRDPPDALMATAAKGTVPPTTTDWLPGVTVTLATVSGAGVTVDPGLQPGKSAMTRVAIAAAK